LGRALLIEGIFLAFFTEWYISRYYPVIPRLDFWLMIVLIILLSFLVIIVGWLRDKKQKKQERESLIER
jgi:membrane protein implicated in regulation of membrane protease activity